jgi:hypothetical protein
MVTSAVEAASVSATAAATEVRRRGPERLRGPRGAASAGGEGISILRTPACVEGIPALADFRIINELKRRRQRVAEDLLRRVARLRWVRADCKTCHN